MRLWILAPLLILGTLSHFDSPNAANQESLAKGVVFEDRNRNGIRDEGEPGVRDVWVSNQRELAKTDREGRWQLPHDNDTMFFVVKPRNWMTPVDKHNKPLFFYMHRPAGSPPNLKYPGLKPTGPLPDSIDFALYKRNEPKEFSALFFGDTQPRDLREVDYIARDIVEPIIDGKEKFDFGVTMGDVVFDDLSVMEPLNALIGLIGVPWYYVLGNHDINFDVPDDKGSDDTWERIYGPSYYSFNHGPTHFVVLDNVEWIGAEEAKRRDPNRTAGFYQAGLGEEQLEWLRRDLKTVPKDQLVVFMMHIPVMQNRDKSELYAIMAERPYALSVSAHTHFQEHHFINSEKGWPTAIPHHHANIVTACGSWWTGAPDTRGVPHTTMRDGAPHGYSVFRFDGNQYKIEFRAARRPASHQMNIIAPDKVATNELSGTAVYANVFGGSEKSVVEYSFNGSEWRPMDKVLEPDPSYVKMHDRDRSLQRPYRPLSTPIPSPHLWKATLNAFLSPGTYPVHVRTTDMFGQKYFATRGIRVE